jgi:hypothetical protein
MFFVVSRRDCRAASGPFDASVDQTRSALRLIGGNVSLRPPVYRAGSQDARLDLKAAIFLSFSRPTPGPTRLSDIFDKACSEQVAEP